MTDPKAPKICTDCGSAPVWWRAAHKRYCRQCSERAGHLYLSRVEVDPDKVLAHFGGPGNEAAVDAFLDEVASDW